MVSLVFFSFSVGLASSHAGLRAALRKAGCRHVWLQAFDDAARRLVLLVLLLAHAPLSAQLLPLLLRRACDGGCAASTSGFSSCAALMAAFIPLYLLGIPLLLLYASTGGPSQRWHRAAGLSPSPTDVRGTAGPPSRLSSVELPGFETVGLGLIATDRRYGLPRSVVSAALAAHSFRFSATASAILSKRSSHLPLGGLPGGMERARSASSH